MTDETTPTGTVHGPICPNCGKPFRDWLRQETITAKPSTETGRPRSMTLVFCGSCGFTLEIAPETVQTFRSLGVAEVAAPHDDGSLEGQFQIRCRDLVAETRALGFNPSVWVPMINALGALGAAKKLLADQHVLVATPWLVARGRSELTLEREIEQMRWADLFTDDERTEAARRLTAAGKSNSD